MGPAKGTITSKYIHVLDAALVMAADTLAGYIDALLDGKSSVSALMHLIGRRGKLP